MRLLALIARVPVPKFVCEVACASGFASYMDDDVPWDTRSYVRKARPNSIALEKGNLGTHMRAIFIVASSSCINAKCIGLVI
jgi:hypothetical protein